MRGGGAGRRAPLLPSQGRASIFCADVLLLFSRSVVQLFVTPWIGFPCGLAGKESSHNVGDLVPSLGWEDPLEEGMAQV